MKAFDDVDITPSRLEQFLIPPSQVADDCVLECRQEGLAYKVMQWYLCRMEGWFAADADRISVQSWDEVHLSFYLCCAYWFWLTRAPEGLLLFARVVRLEVVGRTMFLL